MSDLFPEEVKPIIKTLFVKDSGGSIDLGKFINSFSDSCNVLEVSFNSVIASNNVITNIAMIRYVEKAP